MRGFNRTLDAALNEAAGTFHNEGRVFLHAVLDPFQHDAHKGVLVEVGNKLLFLVGDLCVPSRFLHHTQQQVVNQGIQILLDLFPADAAVDIQDEGLVLLNRVEDVQVARQVSQVFFPSRARFASSTQAHSTRS